jgi:hypothetical protein
VLVLAGLEARGWGFNVAFFLSFEFFVVVVIPLFFVFLLFWCPCILPVCLKTPLRFFNTISFITYQKKV